jgi:hypothetical protein
MKRYSDLNRVLEKKALDIDDGARLKMLRYTKAVGHWMAFLAETRKLLANLTLTDVPSEFVAECKALVQKRESLIELHSRLDKAYRVLKFGTEAEVLELLDRWT